jgi:hypothetical protein
MNRDDQNLSADTPNTAPSAQIRFGGAARWTPWRIIWRVVVYGSLMVATVILFTPPPPKVHHESANYIRCAANLKAIGNAMLLYADANKGQYPDSLSALLLAPGNLITRDELICSDTRDGPAPGPTTAQAAENLGALGMPDQYATAVTRPPQHLSYIYAARGLTPHATVEYVLVYEPLSNHRVKNIYVLYGDGHVDAVPEAEAQKFIAELQSGHNPPRPEMLK